MCIIPVNYEWNVVNALKYCVYKFLILRPYGANFLNQQITDFLIVGQLILKLAILLCY